MSGPGLDGNVWYQMTEHRVNASSALFYSGNGDLYFGMTNKDSMGMYWQIYELSGGDYQLRNRNSNIKKQLSVCRVEDEVSQGKTQPCMEAANAANRQKWKIEAWDDGQGFKIENVANGTGYNLDWHPGNPGFLNDVTAPTPKQPAQHWLFTSLALVDDGIYSTSMQATRTSTTATTTPDSSASNSPASASASSTSTSSSSLHSKNSSDSLSTGAAAGIGVGVAVAVLALAALLLLLLRRKRRANSPSAENPDVSAYDPANAYGNAEHGQQYEKVGRTGGEHGLAEVEAGESRVELDSRGEMWELEGSEGKARR